MGAWIEMTPPSMKVSLAWSRTPRWVRGLKFDCSYEYLTHLPVAPHDGCVDWNRETWRLYVPRYCRTPRWVRGLKFFRDEWYRYRSSSHPTMGAWIEIVILIFLQNRWKVAPHDGCVDWNMEAYIKEKEKIKSHPTMGAWIEIIPGNRKGEGKKSHPTMGAWIEIRSIRE